MALDNPWVTTSLYQRSQRLGLGSCPCTAFHQLIKSPWATTRRGVFTGRLP